MTQPVPAETDALDRWIEGVSGSQWLWFVKYLSANDTYAKPNVHQAGPYLSKALLRSAFPELVRRSGSERNPDLRIPCTIDSHGWTGDVRVVWYNSKILERRANGRDEARITGWGGRTNPVVEPDATGALVVFAFERREVGDPVHLKIWVARDLLEANRILEIVGDIEPGWGALWSASGQDHEVATVGDCNLTAAEIPDTWLGQFPAGQEIVDWILENRDPWRWEDPDTRLIRRRACEYAVFRSVEREHVLPRIRQPFATVDSFLEFSQGVANRRKARAGRSLELQLRVILIEETVPFSWGERTEGARRPDFIFPSIDRYNDPSWSADNLYMLAAKTTCKDRWRQILNEAARIETKHLLTLQEGVSVQQHEEMREEGVQLVVPRSLVPSYPQQVRPYLMTLGGFLELIRSGRMT